MREKERDKKGGRWHTQRVCHRPPSSFYFLVAGGLPQRRKAATEDFLGGGDDDEGVGVHFADERFELVHLGEGDGHHEHFALLLGVHALAVQGGDAAFEVLEDAVGDLPRAGGDDEGQKLLAAAAIGAKDTGAAAGGVFVLFHGMP